MFRDVHELVADSTTNEYLSFTGGREEQEGLANAAHYTINSESASQ